MGIGGACGISPDTLGIMEEDGLELTRATGKDALQLFMSRHMQDTGRAGSERETQLEDQ